jgi:hypothetical protein
MKNSEEDILKKRFLSRRYFLSDYEPELSDDVQLGIIFVKKSNRNPKHEDGQENGLCQL